MISKKFRLREREVKKVFQQKKPFFSNLFIANVRTNALQTNRFAILLGSKNVAGSVERNFFRRSFYREVAAFIQKGTGADILFVPKKKVTFSRRKEASVEEFLKEIRYLLQKIN